jgi:LAO/AO transport system kinase
VTTDLSTRANLGRAITMIESRRADHQAQARTLLSEIMPRTGKAQRIGITGVPGVGKSTFIESFGTMLTGLGLRVAEEGGQGCHHRAENARSASAGRCRI